MTENESKQNGRYPYTYACDYLRAINPEISRSEMSQIRHMIADVIGMKDEDLAKKIADAYQNTEDKIHIFVDDKERFPVPKNAIGFRISTLNGNKIATWREPKI